MSLNAYGWDYVFLYYFDGILNPAYSIISYYIMNFDFITSNYKYWILF